MRIIEEAKLRYVPRGSRFVAEVDGGVSRRDHGWFSARLYVTPDGLCVIRGEGGPASYFARYLPRNCASIEGSGVRVIEPESARAMLRRNGIRDEEIERMEGYLLSI